MKKSTPVKKKKSEVARLLEYFVSGGAWFWSGYIIIALSSAPLQQLYGDETGLFVANFIGNSVGITINYLLQRYWVFRESKGTKLSTSTVKYVIYTVINAYGLNYLILLVLEQQFGLVPAIGQFIAAGFFTVWNYFWYKYYIFKVPEETATKGSGKK